ncbi:MAG: hypothetical protein DRR19_01835 [Candidatus Parabeggiatoa sp. nov. 1]|nr:MAG: hypothetical protein DRR19_01835 [Gammaproteobacteria bacterium]
MRLPRHISGQALALSLKRLGYQKTRQTGSHLRLTTSSENGEHHITIPQHEALRVGTLAAILDDVAQHFQISRDELLEQLFG